jgi:hypothetical protein
MNYSKAHQNFSNHLQKPEALTSPQNFLGPNYETVLNFWVVMDTLSDDQLEEVASRYNAIDHAARVAARVAARDAARVAVGYAAWGAARGAAWDAARDAAWDAARVATSELIGMHTLLNDGKDLLIVPLFNDL